MNIINRLAIGCLALLAVSGNVVAQTITVGDAMGVAGGQATVQLNWDPDGGSYQTLQFDVNFDLGVLPTVDTGTCPIEPYITGYLISTCEQRAAPDDNQVRLGLLPLMGDIPMGNLGQLTFDIDAGASPGTTDLTLSGVVIEGDPVATLIEGQITILGPAYTSDPAPGPLTVGPVIQNDPDPSEDVDITNTGGTGTTLTGTCSETADPDGVFTVSGTTNFSVLAGGPADTVTVTCDSAGSVATHTGTMECTHNGDNIGSPAVYSLSCTITAGPQPAYSSNPAPGTPINLVAPQEGDPITPAQVAISNSGDSGTTLTGTCDVTGNPQISVADGAFSVVQGGAADIQFVSCDSSAQGDYSATLSCDHNGSNQPNPATYEVTCSVGPPGAAIYESTPGPGSTIDITDGLDVVAGDPNPDSPLQIRNGATDPADNDLDVLCALTGAGQISVSPTDITGSGVVLAPNGMFLTDLVCDATAAGDFDADLDCDYDSDGDGIRDDGMAHYDVTCSVRNPESEVEPTPPGGTPLEGLAEPGGSATLSVTFSETNDEGVDGSVDCSLADGTDFVIDTGLPATILSGQSVVVDVTGTDPGDVDSISDTLNCTYFDSDSGEGGVQVSYPLLITFGGSARFEVTKSFTDGADGDVMVSLTCNTGLPLQQQFEISPGNPVVFVVGSFNSGEMDCVVTEGDSGGYFTSYSASGDSQNADDIADEPGCHFFAVAGGDNNTCNITNSPSPVDVTIIKEWLMYGAERDEVDESYTLTLYCDSMIIGGDPVFDIDLQEAQSGLVSSDWFKVFFGVGSDEFVAQVVPNNPYSNCYVLESGNDSSVVVENGCTDIQVSVGNGDTCTITNTVFFEGIPTLSQYGLALMALLMLGVGLLGFRRFA